MEIELRRVHLPLRTPFQTPHGTVAERDVLLVRAGLGWGECAAPAEPTYTSEYVDGAHEVLRRWLVSGGEAPGRVQGHHMAKAALETARLDHQLRTSGQSLASYLGATRMTVPAGIALGLTGSIDALLSAVQAALDEGYQRVKLKIEPGWDIEPVRAVRGRFGDMVALQVDANGSYAGADTAPLLALDDYGLVLVEQPLAADDLLGTRRWPSSCRRRCAWTSRSPPRPTPPPPSPWARARPST